MTIFNLVSEHGLMFSECNKIISEVPFTQLEASSQKNGKNRHTFDAANGHIIQYLRRSICCINLYLFFNAVFNNQNQKMLSFICLYLNNFLEYILNIFTFIPTMLYISEFCTKSASL